ncbi:hypothetical protein ANO14919_049340 [Xylariales sp. No.14919]|nr:hypothetical protein ANO14919_049340 [Xylariales sp. No.14919]
MLDALSIVVPDSPVEIVSDQSLLYHSQEIGE